VLFAERLPALRAAMAGHMEQEPLSCDWTAAVAVRLINEGWFRVGGERYAKNHRTFGITTLRKSHVRVRGSRVSFRFRAKHRIMCRTVLVDDELAAGLKELLAAPGGRRLFRYRLNGDLVNLGARRLNEYIREHMGEEFTAKDFRTWGGTLLAAVALAERGPVETATEQKRTVAAVMRVVGDRLGNTPAVARASYVSPAVVEQYLDGRTIEDFRPRHLRVVGARDSGLDAEEQALVSLLRSWRIRRAREAA
jgi:DNA topoisomerase-1